MIYIHKPIRSKIKTTNHLLKIMRSIKQQIAYVIEFQITIMRLINVLMRIINY